MEAKKLIADEVVNGISMDGAAHEGEVSAFIEMLSSIHEMGDELLSAYNDNVSINGFSSWKLNLGAK